MGPYSLCPTVVGLNYLIAPHREYGSGYLDAVRKVFSDAQEKHLDLVPKDVGLGLYDTAYKARPQYRTAGRAIGIRRLPSAKGSRPY